MNGGIRFFSASPLPVLVIILLIGLVILLIPLLILGVIGAAFTRLGLSWISALALVLLILAGSFVNIPVYRIQRDLIRAVPMDPERNFLNDPFVIRPIWETVISVNLGGAIIPVCIAVYLLYQAVMVAGTAVIYPVAISTLIVMVISFVSTREAAGTGIRIPFLIPALAALLTGVLLTGGTGLTAAVTALVGGISGTIAGGNLAHLFRVRDREVPVVSIGGQGSFGAVFLCCILPALIA